uniref:Uncharacterized protein n=1 Tax=Candidatus Kentrum sp. DK TaxID=2126562 RepID=A0A450SBI6_9GAMM|nr:MAG: hypothetical protein BECKDK2373B_GA0170837_102525 [Candidatus Kentron sp. DK]
MHYYSVALALERIGPRRGLISTSIPLGAVGAEKSRWAEKISPHMDVDKNRSPSFCYFRDRPRGVAPGSGAG